MKEIKTVYEISKSLNNVLSNNRYNYLLDKLHNYIEINVDMYIGNVKDTIEIYYANYIN